MRKNFIVAIFAALLWATGSASAQTVIKYTHFQPGAEDQPKHAAALAFKEHVEEASNGELRVDIYPAGQLGDAGPILEDLQLGTVELAVVHDGPIASFFKPFEILNMPYLFENQQVAYSVFDGPFGEELGEAMRQQTGLRLLGIADNGIRHFTNDVRPIRSPEDMRGLKIRVQPSAIYQRLVESLGASPSAISWPELPGALQQGVVDGQENSVTNVLAASLHQYQDYVTLDGHVYSVHAYLMGDNFYNSLTPEQQQIVQEGVDIAKEIHRTMTTAQDNSAEEILSGLGMDVTVLTPEEIDAFRQAAQPPVREYLEREVGAEWLDKLFAAIDAYEGQ